MLKMLGTLKRKLPRKLTREHLAIILGVLFLLLTPLAMIATWSLLKDVVLDHNSKVAYGSVMHFEVDYRYEDGEYEKDSVDVYYIFHIDQAAKEGVFSSNDFKLINFLNNSHKKTDAVAFEYSPSLPAWVRMEGFRLTRGGYLVLVAWFFPLIGLLLIFKVSKWFRFNP